MKTAGSWKKKMEDMQGAIFVGRDEQLELFEENLQRDPDSASFRNIFMISGQGGIGKSTLVHQLEQRAHSENIPTAYVNEECKSVVDVMASIAASLGKQKHPLKAFDERYKVYQQKKQALNADPEAPPGIARLLGTATATATKVAVAALEQQAPGLGGILPALMGVVDENQISAATTDVINYLYRKIGNREDVSLILDPVEALTPLFMQGVRQMAERQNFVFFFDTYESIGGYLDNWLRNILNCKYGDPPANFIFVISGRKELDKSLWQQLDDHICHIRLDLFTEEETRKYLERKGITNEELVKGIIRVTGRLPFYVAILAAKNPTDNSQLEAVDTVADVFLKWEKDPVQRELAVNAAIPRYLNRDIVSQLADPSRATELFEWLTDQPFLEERPDCWICHALFREIMLAYGQKSSPESCALIHERLAAYFEGKRDHPGVPTEEQIADDQWRGNDLEALYHRLCVSPTTWLPVAINSFAAYLQKRSGFGRQLAETMQQAGMDADLPGIQEWGTRLFEGLQSYEESRFDRTIQVFTDLLTYKDLKDVWRPVILSWRGISYYQADRLQEALDDLNFVIEREAEDKISLIYRALVNRSMGNMKEAIADFTRAIELNIDPLPDAYVDRGIAHHANENFQEAITDYTHALELDPQHTLAYLRRAESYKAKGDSELAMADYDKAIELAPEDATAYAWRGSAHVFLDKHEQALADLGRAIQIDPKYIWAIRRRAEVHAALKQYEQSLADWGRVVELNPEEPAWYAMRGLVHRDHEQYEMAAADFTRAIELKISLLPNAYTDRGECYRLMGKHDEALADFEKALEIDAGYLPALRSRGGVYKDQNKYEQAIECFARAIELDPKDPTAHAWQGEVLGLTGKDEQALEEYNKAIEFAPDYIWAIRMRGDSYKRLGKYEEALADLTKAIELSPRDATAYAWRAETLALMGKHEPALADFTKAIEISPDYSWAVKMRAETFKSLKRYEEALADYAKAIEQNPQDETIYAWRGEVFGLMGKHEQALIDLGRAIALDPGYGWAIRKRAEIYAEMGRNSDSLADWDSAIQLNPKEPTWYAMRGLVQRKLEQYETAAADFTRAIELGISLLPNALTDRGECYRFMGKHEEALADFAKALEINPNHLPAMRSRGGVYKDIGKYDQAINAFTKSIELDNQDATAYAWRGEVFGLTGKFEQALADLGRAIGLEPKYSWAISKRAGIHAAMGRGEEALADWDRAIQINPEEPAFYAERGLVKRDLEQYEAAVADFTRAIELKIPMQFDVHFDRGECYRLMGRHEDALRDFAEALESNPQHPNAERLFVRRAKVRRKLKKFSEALEDLENAVQLGESNDWGRYQRSLVYCVQGRQDEFAREVQEAIRLVNKLRDENPDSTMHAVNLAIYQLALREPATAEKIYREALLGSPHVPTLQEAVWDLDELLEIIPELPKAREMRQLLVDFISKR